MSHWIPPDAETELGDAALYYATHASRAIAEAFQAEYERVLDLLVENQQRRPHLDGDLRVYHFDKFPNTVVYAENERKGPQIFAVVHQSREPEYWGGRL
ncbi:MAG: type II toxin-antitoxin system RelE/ParE family toxin [Methylibium sp.]|uniref:type II toxin-antitoxin system RelE/ParE family toxin n=1 Tax=Methylibium sp. TaxID=2067992 RepID=UPI00180C06B9|nr:type II toxin-antitoxin system RelE/ParE family toxin [Methylibium sp.]MBA3597643.1 type II toxin-antitoxin system RelE/ParE family toxin [Methylibium sp.]